MKYPSILIDDNLYSGDCGLWYDVLAIVNGKLIHHVCPYKECKSFLDAIDFYVKHYYNEETHKPIKVCHHKFDKETLKLLSLAA
jgi:hypothetical protein